jgi:isopenicillin N synthase-like dioxygenase
VKVVRYPGVAAGLDDQGMGPHKDYGFLAFVLQDDQGGSRSARGRGVAPILGAVPLPSTLAERAAPSIDPQNPIYAELGRNAPTGLGS